MSATHRPEAKGWCPGAYRPMMSGDGLVVRVRPTCARLTADQVMGLCEVADALGNGVIDLTSRANLQIRGVSEDNHAEVLQRLAALDLLRDDPALESRRNILISPFWQDGDITFRIVQELTARLGELPELPAKVGFAIDTGPAPVFRNNSADFRLEHSPSGELLVLADGMARGHVVDADTAVDALIEMAHWFETHRGAARRMAPVMMGQTRLPIAWQATLNAAPAPKLVPGPHDMGAIYGAAFGQLDASRLSALVSATGATALRVTPWRLFLLEEAEMADTSDFITRADDPLFHIDACPGAPRCNTATVDTRQFAQDVAGRIKGPLHISGCAKGCARPRKTQTTLVGRDGKFDLVRNGLPWDEPVQTGLSPDTLLDIIGDI
ncbi:cobalamin biosynthesis protein CobG [Shimia thalassica]|uniref:cobalamin biosynthesis protein CobG n=1 Tax=Shimia thalassica TaxID=1715693 RepID=UPI0026E29182|nr:cobalamin biosynthesis protein CobG [Shimia thalassica]MDO6800288.1 cobalamin biosynthesis protein CobG [Shimia thalassica]